MKHDDLNAIAFNKGYDDFPTKANPYPKGERVSREYERGFMVAGYYARYRVGHDDINGWYVYRMPTDEERDNGNTGRIIVEGFRHKWEAFHVCELHNRAHQ